MTAFASRALFVGVALSFALPLTALADKPAAFEVVVAKLDADAKRCPADGARELEAIKLAKNVTRGPQVKFIALSTSSHPGSDDIGPLTAPATPEQLKSLVGKKYCH